MDYLFLILGFGILLISGDFLVRAASEIAIRFDIPKIVIGLLVVSLGTSAPELLVSLQAALKGHPEMAVGNVIGSNISNIALVLGLTAIIYPIVVKSKTILFDWSLMILASILLYIFSLDYKLELYEGIIFITILVIYIFISIKYRKNKTEENEDVKPEPLLKSLGFLLVSMVGLYFGADFLIDSASSIALDWGVSERVISVTIIAFGTSVPELATSVIAALKKEMDISIGNIIGSNIFNILSILGITSIVKSIEFDEKLLNTDMLWMLGISFALILSILPIKNGTITRYKGFVFVLIYFAYIYLQFN